MEGRKTKAARNIAYGLLGQVITIILSFISRSVFLYCFTKEYVGISSLFAGILSFLSLADLGMEASMTVKLYRPLAEENWPLIKALLGYYKRIFNVIALVIFGAGLLLLPVLDMIVDIPENVEHVKLIYVLTLANSSVTYLFIYKKILFIADQKKYITDITQYCVTFSEYAVLIPLLLITRSYILYLLTQCGFKLIYNFVIMALAKKKYVEVDAAQEIKLDDTIKRSIGSDMRAISLHRIGDVVSTHSWTILVSSCVNVVTAGLYSNYQLIIGYVKVIMDKVLYALSPSIGNMIVTETEDAVYGFFEKMMFMSFAMTCICGNCLLCLLNPFIDLWIGDTFQLTYGVVMVSVINFYLVNMRKPVLIFKEAYGFFKQDRFRPLIESGISIMASLFLCLAAKLELAGVLLGTTFAYLVTTFWIEPWILFRNGFHKKCRLYFVKYVGYIAFTTAIMLLSASVCGLLESGFFTFILSGMVSVAVPAGGIFLVFRRTEEYRWFAAILSRSLRKLLHKQLA